MAVVGLDPEGETRTWAQQRSWPAESKEAL